MISNGKAVLCAPPGVNPLRYDLDSFACQLRAERAWDDSAVVELRDIATDIDLPQELCRLPGRIMNEIFCRLGALLQLEMLVRT